MIQLKIFLIVSILTISMLFNTTGTVQANENPMVNYNVDIVIPINHLDVPNLLKEQVLDSLVDLDANFKLENIDFEKTSIIMEPLDITKVSHTDTNILVNIVNKTDAATLTPSSINISASIDIVDTTPPELVLSSSQVTIKVDSEFDPWEYVEYAYDNSQEYPTVALINNVDTSKEGEYEVLFAACNSSGNRNTTTLKVKVSKFAVRTQSVVYNGDDILYMLDLINAARADNGLAPLALADEAGQNAVGVRAMEAASYLSHKRPDGSHYKTALNDFGVSYSNSPLEVLTYSGNSVESKFNWWMGSPNHRAILMANGYSTIAIAYSGRMWCAIVY